MTLTEDSAHAIAEQFQEADPDDRYKESRRVSRRELVRTLYDAIIAKRKAGYTFEGIAAHLASLGASMSVSTLKTYLRDAGRHAKATHATGSRKGGTQRVTEPAVHAPPQRPNIRSLEQRARPVRPAAGASADAGDGSREKDSQGPADSTGKSQPPSEPVTPEATVASRATDAPATAPDEGRPPEGVAEEAGGLSPQSADGHGGLRLVVGEEMVARDRWTPMEAPSSSSTGPPEMSSSFAVPRRKRLEDL